MRRPRWTDEKRKPSIFWFLAAIAEPIFGTATRYRVHDAHRMPREGAFVLAPNHYSEIDPVVMGHVVWRLGRAPRFLAKADLFTVPVLGGLLRASGQIPVERAGTVRGSEPLTAARRLVEEGRLLIVYPEGSLTRDPDLWPMRGKTGAVRIALEQNIPLVPVAHWGTQQLMGRYSKKLHLLPPKTIDVKFGEAVDLSAYRDRPLDSATLNAATTVVMDAITALLEDLRGEKAPSERWNPKANNQKETGRFE
ncbi:lysophospholipid acyltransferase family protein [Planctomonas psychrotolerans]|uniref:lysophospholipid acyltransferase family protein n=1 Tax=Planctomonas psychrotolerans TaxID=2528712 RepID=UPI001239A040|nr:lysophospholipid acyltransferase family protein [Planctomonas psychrotolerans]